MKTLKTLVAGIALMASAAASATPVLPGSETPLQNVIYGLYTAAGTNTTFAPNVNTNQAGLDQLFAIEASGGSVATIVIELAGNAGVNRLGVYDAFNKNNRVELYSGAAGAGNSVVLGIDDAGNIFRNFSATGATFAGNLFGYYLETPGGIFYSQMGLNANNADQMVAFQGDGDKIKLPGKPAGIWGSSSYIIAWEDIAYGASDKDFNDFVFYVESVTGVPEPGVLASLALGLLAFGFTARRRRN